MRWETALAVRRLSDTADGSLSASPHATVILGEITWIHSKGRGPNACEHRSRHVVNVQHPASSAPLCRTTEPARVGKWLCRCYQAGLFQP